MLSPEEVLVKIKNNEINSLDVGDFINSAPTFPQTKGLIILAVEYFKGGKIAIKTKNGAQLWDINTQSCIGNLAPANLHVTDIKKMSESTLVVGYGLYQNEETIQIWDVNSIKCVKKYKTGEVVFYIVVFSNKFACFGNNFIKIYDLTSDACITSINHENAQSAIALSDDILGYCTATKYFKMFNINTGKLINEFLIDGESVNYNHYSVTKISSKIVAISGYAEGVKIWDVERNKCIQILKVEYSKSFCALAFLPKTNRIVTGSGPAGVIQQWDYINGNCLSFFYNDDSGRSCTAITSASDTDDLIICRVPSDYSGSLEIYSETKKIKLVLQFLEYLKNNVSVNYLSLRGISINADAAIFTQLLELAASNQGLSVINFFGQEITMAQVEQLMSSLQRNLRPTKLSLSNCFIGSQYVGWINDFVALNAAIEANHLQPPKIPAEQTANDSTLAEQEKETKNQNSEEMEPMYIENTIPDLVNREDLAAIKRLVEKLGTADIFYTKYETSRVPIGDPGGIRCAVTLIALAARKGAKEIVSYLCDKGVHFSLKKEEVIKLKGPRNLVVEQNVEAHSLCPLSEAVQKNNKEMVLLLLSRGISVNSFDYQGYTPLMNAARHGLLEMVKLLIAKGANVSTVSNKKNFITVTAFLFAYLYEHEEIAYLLVQHGADVNVLYASNHFTYNLNDLGIERRSKWMLQFLFSPVFDDVYIKVASTSYNTYRLDKDDGRFFTQCVDQVALFRLARIGHKAGIYELLDTHDRQLYCDINESDEYGNTALHHACMSQQPLSIRALVNKGANVNLTNSDGDTPLALLINYCENETQDILGVFRDLVRATDSNMQNAKGDQVAKIALEKKHFKMFEILRNNGLNLDLKNNDGFSLFMSAVKLNYENYARQMMISDDDIFDVTTRGENVLMLSAYKRKNEMGAKFIASGVPVDTVNKQRKTAFIIALENENIFLCQRLIATRLLFLIANNQISCPDATVLNFLFQQGGHINQRDSKSRTLFHVAAACSNSNFIEYIIQWQKVGDSAVEAKDGDGKTVDDVTGVKYKDCSYHFNDVVENSKILLELAASDASLPIIKKLLSIYQAPNQQVEQESSGSLLARKDIEHVSQNPRLTPPDNKPLTSTSLVDAATTLLQQNPAKTSPEVNKTSQMKERKLSLHSEKNPIETEIKNNPILIPAMAVKPSPVVIKTPQIFSPPTNDTERNLKRPLPAIPQTKPIPKAPSVVTIATPLQVRSEKSIKEPIKTREIEQGLLTKPSPPKPKNKPILTQDMPVLLSAESKNSSQYSSPVQKHPATTLTANATHDQYEHKNDDYLKSHGSLSLTTTQVKNASAPISKIKTLTAKFEKTSLEDEKVAPRQIVNESRVSSAINLTLLGNSKPKQSPGEREPERTQKSNTFTSRPGGSKEK